jgi:hypothetical protein
MTSKIHTPASDMPDEITGQDGKVYFRTRFTNETLKACEFGAGHICHEYWAFEEGHEEDTFRLQAIDATKFWVD